ncbi:MAG: DUF5916 domain-containing protein [Gemmatimonadota bacterium]
MDTRTSGREFSRVAQIGTALAMLCATTASAQTTVLQDRQPVAREADAPQAVPTDAPREARSATGARAEAVASRYAGPPIEIDGALDDAVWLSAQWSRDFLQKDPDIGAVPTQATEVAFAYDADALYIGARMHDTEPDRIVDQVTRRDQGGRADVIVFSFDTYNDRRTAYTFAVTAGGSRSDWYHPQDREYNRDHTFDPVWEARTRMDSTGWTVEARIPFSQLRFNEGADAWGLNMNRWLPSRNEDLYWVVVPRDEPGWSSQMGRLSGLAGIEPHRRLEISPYIAGNVAVTSGALVDRTDPFASTSDFVGRVGADLKYGLGPNLTLDATVNPDFGQVDADPAIVNLSAFETFFPERRPFFTEGSSLLTGSNRPGYFYSRRIGASPHGFAGGDFSDVPDVTTILGATKLTGRLGSGLSIGAVTALTAAESATTYDAGTETFDQVQVEPTTGYGAVRLQQELGENSSTVGFTGTAVARSLGSDDPTRDILGTSAFTGGGDFNLRLDGGTYEVKGHAGLSYVRGSEEAIGSLQRRSARYFQRPDQDHVSFDPARTSLLGGTASLAIEKNAGEHWLWNGGAWIDSPGLELNDLGRLSRADDIQSWAGLTYRETTPGSMFRNYSASVRAQSGWNFGGVDTRTEFNLNLSSQLLNYWSVNLGASHSLDAFDDRRTRGGPLIGRDDFQSVSASIGNNFTSTVRLNFHGFWGNLHHGSDYNVGFDVNFEPTDRLRVSIGPDYSRNTDRRQFYGFRDRSDDRTFGTRYVFSTVEQSEISVPIRLNYAFHPDLSLELWAQPFAASGRFSEFGEVPEARSFDIRRYGTDGTSIEAQVDPEAGRRTYAVADGPDRFTLPDANFNTLSFRSNLVMRWELRPGSTLFLVWQQNLSETSDRGSYVGPGQLFDAFGAPGQNVLAVKMSYWMPM